jgi:hypothetical protein
MRQGREQAIRGRTDKAGSRFRGFVIDRRLNGQPPQEGGKFLAIAFLSGIFGPVDVAICFAQRRECIEMKGHREKLRVEPLVDFVQVLRGVTKRFDLNRTRVFRRGRAICLRARCAAVDRFGARTAVLCPRLPDATLVRTVEFFGRLVGNTAGGRRCAGRPCAASRCARPCCAVPRPTHCGSTGS